MKNTRFDPETVIWTDTPVERVLERGGVYKNAAEIDPNASKTEDVQGKNGGIQKPYLDEGGRFSAWSYSEFLWTHFYPVGCGRLAAMAAGGIDREVVQINEDTCWDGSPYGTLEDENGNVIRTMSEARETKGVIRVRDGSFTGGSVKGGWRYYRGADADGRPAEIGSESALVGDEEFRKSFPEFADKSISSLALGIDNSRTADAVQGRQNLHGLVEAKFLGAPYKQRAYKSFVELYLDFGHSFESAENYIKSLDLESGVVTTEYDAGGIHYKREVFASYPDQAVVTRIETDGELDFSAELHTYHSTECRYAKISDREIRLRAAVTDGNRDGRIAETNMIQFEARMLIEGDCVFSVSDDGKIIFAKGGKSAAVYIIGATNYVNFMTLDNSKPARDCDRYSENIKKRGYAGIRARHMADFASEFSKSSLTLGGGASDIPTEKRLRRDIGGNSGFMFGSGADLRSAAENGITTSYDGSDRALAALIFNFGKYLILSGSRPGRKAENGGLEIPESQPLNLTGKWNAAMTAGWNGKYTININTEMNYWAAQVMNLSGCERPLLDALADLAKSGSVTADFQYGIGDSKTYRPGDPWVTHHNFDLWRGTQPIDNATAGLWPTGGAWLLHHAWQYYQYNKDEKYLAELYPYMAGAARFFTEFLVADPKTGYLITAASCSPEQGGVQPGPAMDTQLIHSLYDIVSKAAAILGKADKDAELLGKIVEQMPSEYFADEKGKIAPDIIDENGLISEWARGDVSFDFGNTANKTEECFPNITNPFSGETLEIKAHAASNRSFHRHCSHLWELYPGTRLNPRDGGQKRLFEAFRKSLAAKDDADGKGWSLAWRMNLNARALRSEKAEDMLRQIILCRMAPNLFDQHPDFQIDGNLGAAAGIAEMLIQSHTGAIDLLPALPSAWKCGEFRGFKTRENAEVSAAWKDGKLTDLSVKALNDGVIRIRIKVVGVFDPLGNAAEHKFDPETNITEIRGKAGETYKIDLAP